MQSNDTAPRRRAPRRLPIERPCDVCSTVYTVWISSLEQGHGKYCGRACFELHRLKGETRECEQCGEPFYARPEKIKRGIGRFCGKPCFDEFQRGVPMMERLWSRVDRNGPIPPHQAAYGNCWIFTGRTTPNGYGTIYRHFPDRVLTHRATWEEATGETLTSENVIGHICDNPPCVRNDAAGWYNVAGVLLPRRGHLFKGTHADNVRDMNAKGRAIHWGNRQND
jgi:hypothetical protein